MSTPSSYFKLSDAHELLRARAFRLLMSDEVPSLDGPYAAALFDLVGDMTDAEVEAAIALHGEAA